MRSVWDDMHWRHLRRGRGGQNRPGDKGELLVTKFVSLIFMETLGQERAHAG
jgi:hypothetical protein